jgi:uncharacterized membrane protein
MTEQPKTKRHRTQEIALLLATAAIPRSFQPSLLARSTADQGIVTGLTVVMVYLLGLITQDVVESASTAVATEADENAPVNSVSPVVVVASIAAIGLGLLAERLNPYEADEKLPRSAIRTSGYWLKNTGIAGLFHSAISATNEVVSQDKEAAEKRDLLPYFLAAGLLFTLVGEYKNAQTNEDFSIQKSLIATKPLRVVGIGVAVAGVLASLAYTERFIAKQVDETLDTVAPQLKKSWLPVGHVIGGGAMVGGIYMLLKRTYNKIEHSAGNLEAGFADQPESSLVSGSHDSLVAWETLSVQGRRHVSTSLIAAHIAAVTQEPAIAPIRVYVGLDSAPTEEDRIELALSELERTGAYERDAIVVVSPTGTGYVNYVMSDAVEYLSRGNVASVALQYSKRPSPMSLDKVDRGHIQHRMLLNAIRKRLASLPAKAHRPRILLFGESLGAWTSQDSLMHEGTDGLMALNIDRALWIGTPKGSKWKDQIIWGDALTTDRELVGVFDNYNDVQKLAAKQREKIRYTLLTHNNDPIAHFGLETLIKQPEWVADDTKRPKGLSRAIYYRTPALFVQTLIDMKNALKPIPGKFVASAHDYRADLANFVAFCYGFTASPEQMVAIEKALRENEITREERMQRTY